MPLDDKLRCAAAAENDFGNSDTENVVQEDKKDEIHLPEIQIPEDMYPAEKTGIKFSSEYKDAFGKDSSRSPDVPKSKSVQENQVQAYIDHSALKVLKLQLNSILQKIEDLEIAVHESREKQDQDNEQRAEYVKEKMNTLESAINEVGKKQAKNDRQLAQYIKENANFQVQVRQGMQEELEELRKEQKGDHFNLILKELSEIFSVYKPLLLGGTDSGKLQKNIAAMFDQIQELLEDYEAEVFVSEIGEERKNRFSKIIKKVPTGEKEKHNTVVRSVRPGVRKGKVVLSEEYIDVFVFDESLMKVQEERRKGGVNPDEVAGESKTVNNKSITEGMEISSQDCPLPVQSDEC